MSILGLPEQQQLQASHERYHRENPEVPRARCKQCKLDRERETNYAVKFVCDCAKEGARYTVQELARATGRRPSWVRKILRQAGLSAPEQPRAPWVPIRQRPCANCGHIKCRHCRGTSPQRHVNPTLLGWYPCPLRAHCRGEVEIGPEQFVNCSCTHYSARGPR